MSECIAAWYDVAMLLRNFTRALAAFASLWLVTSVATAQDRADAVLQGLLADVDVGLRDYLFEAPAGPEAIADRVEVLIGKLTALQPPPDTQVARRISETVGRAGRAALRARPVVPAPEEFVLPDGALSFERDLDQVDALRLPLPPGDWRVLVFSDTPVGREVAVNKRRQAVAPGTGVLVLGARADDDGATIAFLAPVDLQRVVAEPVAGPSLLGDALPAPTQTADAMARIDAAMASAVPQQTGALLPGSEWEFVGCAAVPVESAAAKPTRMVSPLAALANRSGAPAQSSVPEWHPLRKTPARATH